jgi:hypothetical protein
LCDGLNISAQCNTASEVNVYAFLVGPL